MKMKILLVLLLVGAACAQNRSDPVTCQLVNFKRRTNYPIGIMTTAAGAPVEYKDATTSLNTRLLQNEHLIETMAGVVRQNIPERIVHAKAAGAFGYFEVTHDITNVCNAALFRKVGQITPVAARFSPVVPERGGQDTVRDVRGFAVKFYSSEGNFDIVGFNTPMFVYKDPLLFLTFARSIKRNPATNLRDQNMLWDMITLNPESLHLFLLVFSDRGIPDGYRHMPGFGIHAFQVVNNRNENRFILFHILPDAGIKNLRNEEAAKIAGIDPDYAIRDLYNAIAKGKFPSWTMYIQVLTAEDVKKERERGLDIFDVTITIPLDRYPLRPVGRIVLNRNPYNHFAEVEQLAFSPGNLVPYILGSPDKVFEARRLAYRDAQNYRLGGNFNKIRVNCPMRPAYTYNRDGKAPVKDNGYDSPNYYPNTFNGPVPYFNKDRVELIDLFEGPPNNFDQMTELYNNEFTKEERGRVVENIVLSLSLSVPRIQRKALEYFYIISPDLGSRVEKALGTNLTLPYC